MSESPTRRTFLAGAAALPAAGYGRVLGANDRVGVGFVGFGLIGKRHVLDFKAIPDADCVAVAEVHRGRLDQAKELLGPRAAAYPDFRKLLEDKAVDAVVVSTPDHWHALVTMMACATGKDVYVEKPLTLFAAEGRWMIDAATRHKRVVQVGTQQRSGKHYQRARELVRGGHIGRVHSVRMTSVRNVHPGFGSPPDGDPPQGFDYDLWLGPAPKRPYNPNRGLYHFRWFWDYSGGQTTNLAAHHLDIADWFLGLGTLRSAYSAGGRFALADNGETPDTQDAAWSFDGWTATFTMRECSRGSGSEFGLEFFGTKGSLPITRSGFRVFADPDAPPANAIPGVKEGHPAGGPRAVAVGDAVKSRTEPVEDRTGDAAAQFRDHARDFLDRVKDRKAPVSDLESGHRVAVACHLANLSLRLGRSLRWDAKAETTPDDPEAAKLLVRPYRAPWDRELAALTGR